MKRAIIPIYIYSENIKIVNYKELEKLYEQNINLYSVLLYNGDVNRMSFAFSKLPPHKEAKIKSIEEIGYVNNNTDPLSLRQDISLLSNLYKTDTLQIADNININGFHKHKTVLNGNCNKVEITHNLSFCHLLLVDIVLIVKECVVLSISNAMLDNVEIIVENKGELRLTDVEFSNNNKECIRLKKGSSIKEYYNVRFFDVFRRFHIEYVLQGDIGILTDFTDGDKILEFLNTSRIEKIELFNDFTTSLKNIEIEQSIEFINKTKKNIIVNIPKMTISENFILNGDFKISSKISIIEAENVKIALSMFYGTLFIEESSNIYLSNTNFNENLEKSFICKNSSIFIDYCFFENLEKFIYIAGTQVNISNCEIKNVNELIATFEHEKNEDEMLVQNLSEFNSINVSKCLIKESIFLRSHKFLKSLNIKKSRIENVNKFLEVSNVQKVSLEEIKGEYVNTLIDCKNTILKAKEITLRYGEIAFILEGSTYEIDNLSVKKYDCGAKLISGTLEIHNSIFENDFGIVLEGHGANLSHHKCDFSGCTQRKFLLKPGATIINLEESKELECQIS